MICIIIMYLFKKMFKKETKSAMMCCVCIQKYCVVYLSVGGIRWGGLHLEVIQVHLLFCLFFNHNSGIVDVNTVCRDSNLLWVNCSDVWIEKPHCKVVYAEGVLNISFIGWIPIFNKFLFCLLPVEMWTGNSSILYLLL